ncbi:MAG: hypothetical protein ABFS56_26465, partial [Pseudomonadota bacterium]
SIKQPAYLKKKSNNSSAIDSQIIPIVGWIKHEEQVANLLRIAVYNTMNPPKWHDNKSPSSSHAPASSDGTLARGSHKKYALGLFHDYSLYYFTVPTQGK